MRRLVAVCGTAMTILAWSAGAGVVHVSPSGSDGSGDGSLARPFRTVEHGLRSTRPGMARGQAHVVYLEPGAVFRERIVIGPDAGGGPEVPVVLTSSPSNPAVIAPPPGLAKAGAARAAGVSVYNKGNVTIENQKVTGSGMDSNADDGISCYADNKRYSGLTIKNCDVSGWGKAGIVVGGWGGDVGFENVLIEGCKAHDNQNAGISVWAELVTGNQNVIARDCQAYNNLGDPDASSHTGSGIVFGGVTDGSIEYCSAWNNGERCKTTGGPIGIWAWFCTRVTIQHCVAYENHAINCDGGGFDLDGGCQNCTIQYCYSRDNDGAGYLVCQYSGARAFTGNVVRYNISENDGHRNGFAGIHFWSAGSNGGIQNTHIYGNTVYNGVSSVVRFQNTSGQSGTRLWNNLFIAANGKKLVDGSPSTSAATFQGNCYWAGTGTVSIAGYNSLDAWRTAKGQETMGGSNTGVQGDPKVSDPGNGGTPTPRTLSGVDAYLVNKGSACIDAGVDLEALSVSGGGTDFYGNTAPRGHAFDIGAHESAPSTAMTPLNLALPRVRQGSNATTFTLLGRVARPPSPGTSVYVSPEPHLHATIPFGRDR